MQRRPISTELLIINRLNYHQTQKKMMGQALLLLLLVCSFSAISAHKDEDPSIRTMEEFSGYPIHEPHSSFTGSVSSLSVDAQSLQKQVVISEPIFDDVTEMVNCLLTLRTVNCS